MTINSVSDFYDFLKHYSQLTRSSLYRGVKSIDHTLLPGIGRLKTQGSMQFNTNNELKMLELFRQKAHPYLEKEYNNLELLAMAQHFGLPTRLLDWTWNPLVAAYFAVRDDWTKNETKKDSAIYVWRKSLKIKGEINPTFDPFTIKEVTIFLPRHLTKRIIAQSGIFTVHNKPYEPFDSSDIDKIVIVESVRKAIKKTLNELGLHESAMFPDLEGVAKYVKWLRTDTY